MNCFHPRLLSLCLLLMVGWSATLSANHDRDSLLLDHLPQVVTRELESIALLTSDGHHPSEFQFAIANADQDQIAAWMRGDFFALQGMFTAPPENGKEGMFANIQQALAKAKNAINEVQRIGNFVSQFDGQSLITLPVGEQKIMADGTQFIIAINKITLYPTHAELDVYAKVETPDMERPLYFGAPDIKFTRRGGISLGSLGLLGEMEIPVMNKKGYLLFKGAQIVDNEFVSGTGNYVTFDCDGLQEFNLDVDLAFSRNVIVPAYEDHIPIDSIPVLDSITNDTIYLLDSTALFNNRVIAELDLNVDDGSNTAAGLNNILVSLDINTPFYHPGHPKVIFEVQDVVFDFSATQHDSDVAFPIAGHTPELPPEMIDNWKGVYIRTFSVTMTDGLFSSGEGEANPLTIAAYDMVIDRSGFSGYVEITPVLDLNQGNADGWGYSIDWTQIHIYRNSFVGMEFGGVVDVPLLRDEDEEVDPDIPLDQRHINYTAAFDFMEKRYGFSVADSEERVYQSGMLKATITLSPASTLSINYSEADGFEIFAELHGTIVVDAPLGNNDNGSRLSIPEFNFQDFVIGNREPYVHHTGVWSLDEIAVNFGGFDLTISDVGLVSAAGEPRNVDMQFLGLMNLGANSTDISAAGGFRLRGEVVDRPDGKQDWKFKKVKMDALFVDFESPAVAFEGHIIFFEDDATFGGGFQGKMSLELKKLSEIGDIGIEAMALFGAVDDYRYFFVDVMARFPSNFLTLAGIDIRGLGGGVYVNMRQQDITQNFTSAAVGDILPEYPIDAPISDSACGCDNEPPIPICVLISGAGEEEEFATYLNRCEAICAGYTNEEAYVSCGSVPATEYEMALRERLGVSLSGIQYVPDASVKIGINFGIVIATTGDEEKFNANLLLNMEFNDAGSVNRVRLSGYANTMAPISWSGPSCEGISIKFEMEYVGGHNTESGNGRFTARAMVFVNTDRIRGANPPPPAVAAITDCSPLLYAGGVDMLFSKDDWYVWLGVPNNNPGDTTNLPPFPHYPIALELTGIGITVSGYMNIGTQLPPFPGLPDNVAALSEFTDNLLMDEATRASGNGFAFGLRIQAEGGFNIGIVSSDFYLDAGFDLMMQKYTDVYCSNTGNHLGVNGWYAAGQGWVYLDIVVRVLGFDVLDAAIAAVIQAKGPNPTYIRGTIAGRYSVMGGLKKGTFNRPFEKGQECEIEGGGSPALDYAIIGGIIPVDMAGGVFVQTQPNISFNYPVGNVVSINGENGPENYIVELDEFIVELDGGTTVDGELIISDNGYSADFLPSEMFAGESDYVIYATATLYPCTEAGTITGGPIDTDVKTINFSTGEGIDYIPLSNVASAWPGNGQFNYYQGESFGNYIQLASGQDDLFADPETSFLIRLSNDSDELEVPATYNAADNRIDFDLPDLLGGAAFKLELIAQNPGTEVEDGNLLEMYFRVSKYNTAQEKMSGLNFSDFNPTAPRREFVAEILDLQEPFGYEEMIGLTGASTAPLSITADLDNTPWWNDFSNVSFPGVPSFDLYGDLGCGFNASDLNYEIYGLPRQQLAPQDAVFITQENTELFLVSKENYLQFHADRNANLLAIHGITPSLNYNVKIFVQNDFYELRRMAYTSSLVNQFNDIVYQACEVNDGGSTDSQSLTAYNQLSDLYDNLDCFKKFYSILSYNDSLSIPQEGDPCENGPPFRMRQLGGPSSELSSPYPIVIDYHFPNGTTINFTHTLQFP